VTRRRALVALGAVAGLPLAALATALAVAPPAEAPGLVRAFGSSFARLVLDDGQILTFAG